MQHFLLFVLLIASAFSQQVADDVDLPGAPSPLESLAVGSWVVPMDITNNGISGKFNIKVYGLVNTLLYANIPVKWAIKTPKVHGEVDFSASVWKLLPTDEKTANVQPKTVSFKSGPFVIPAFFVDPANTNPNAPGQNALSIARAYITKSATTINVFQLAAVTQIPIKLTVNKKPYIAVLDSSKNNKIQTDLLAAAGFVAGTHYSIMSKEQAVAIAETQCITMATEPHFHAADDGGSNVTYPATFVTAMRKFVKSGGNFLAQCAGIATYEECDNIQSTGKVDRTVLSTQNICPDGFFMSKNGGLNLNTGIYETNTAIPPASLVPETPYAQYEGNWVTQGGSVMFMSMWNTLYDGVAKGNSTLRSENRAHFVIQENPKTRTLTNYGIYYAAHAKLQQYQGRFGGNVYFLAGHSYDETAPGARLYLNAVLSPARRDGKCGFDIQPCSWGNFNREFQGNVLIKDPRMSNGGIIAAFFQYSWTNAFVGFQFGVNQSESNLYNKNRGGDFADQEVLLRSNNCCSLNKLLETMPVLFPCPDEWTFAGSQMSPALADVPAKNCSKYVRNKITEGDAIDYMLINEDVGTADYGKLCYFKTTSGREVWFKTYTAVTAGVIAPSIPINASDCVCSAQLDVAIVLDRRSSIVPNDFLLQKKFVTGIAQRMGIAPDQVTLTFIHYNTNAWISLRLREGISPAAVTAGLNGLICCTNNTCGAGKCCCGSASVSSGIRAAADELKTSVRPYATKIMMVISSNYHDTKSNGAACYSACSAFLVGTDAWENCAAQYKDSCRTDLQQSVDYAATLLPNIQMYAVGVDNYVWDELQIISRGSSYRTFAAVTWDQLTSMSVDITAQSCNDGATACDDTCCGLCLCKACLPPTFCNDGILCTNESLVGGCCVAPPVNCDSNNTNKCQVGSCSAATGCSYTNLTCLASNDCFDYVCNPTKGLPCDAIPKWTPDVCKIIYCDPNNNTIISLDKCLDTPCTIASCDPLTGTCTSTPKPPPSNDRCFKYTCDSSVTSGDPWTSVEIPGCRGCPINCTSCQFCTNITGTYECQNQSCSPVPCYSVVFDPTEESCCKLNFTCDDGNPCTIDTCSASGNCQNVLRNCSDGNICTQDFCNITSGECYAVRDESFCNDNSLCTIDSCSDSLQACVNANISCTVEGNKCRDDYCDPAVGCVPHSIVCADEDSCTMDTCDPEAGCRYNLLVCDADDPTMTPRRADEPGKSNSSTATVCAVASCNATSGNCTLRAFECKNDTILLAATIGTAALVGIIIAVIVVVAGCTGGTAAYVNYRYNNEDNAAIKNNPLYEDQSKGGDNPLWGH